MGQSLSRVPERVEQIKAKIHEHQQNRKKRGPRMKRTEKTTICIDADFQLRQQCVWNGKPEIKSFNKPTFVHVEHLEGEEISFAYIPQMRMDAQPHRVLKIPRSVANSNNICKLYHEMCRQIYAYDRANGLAKPNDSEDDICLWIKPYAEIRVERNMNGVEERKCIKATIGTTRLKNRMMFVKWMLENSDWQEQLVRNFWNLPKNGVGRDVTLPWFSLEVEYKPNGRRKLFETHKHEFEARKITLEMFHPPEVVIEAEGMIIGSGEIMVEAGRIVIEDKKMVVEAGEVVVTDGETVVEFGGVVGGVVFEDRGRY